MNPHDKKKESINMLTSIIGTRLSWHFANGWVFEPAIVGPDIVEYTLTAGPHAGRHAIQHFYYQRVAPGVETTVWYEESGALVHITWYLETQTVHRFAALPAWLAADMTVYRGDNQDPAFIAKMTKGPVAFVTVAAQSYRTASADPVNALRHVQ